ARKEGKKGLLPSNSWFTEAIALPSDVFPKEAVTSPVGVAVFTSPVDIFFDSLLNGSSFCSTCLLGSTVKLCCILDVISFDVFIEKPLLSSSKPKPSNAPGGAKALTWKVKGKAPEKSVYKIGLLTKAA